MEKKENMVQGEELWMIENEKKKMEHYPMEKLYKWLKLVQAKELTMGEEEEKKKKKRDVNEGRTIPIEEILKFFSLQFLSTLSLQCKEWNDLIHSKYFITNKWASLERKPWLVVHFLTSPYCLGFSFALRTWLHPFPFQNDEVMLYGSVAGRLLLGNDNPSFTFDVFNPLTRRSLRLPPLLCGYQYHVAGIYEKENGTYLVVVMGKQITDNKFSVQIYDSMLGRWTNLLERQRDVGVLGTTTTKGEWMGPDVVFSKHVLYTLSDLDISVECIACFNIKTGDLFFEKFPEMPTNIDCVPFHYLLACGSHLLLAVAIFGGNSNLFEEIIIWELKKKNEVEVGGSTAASSSSSWEEIARMPPTDRHLVNLISRVEDRIQLPSPVRPFVQCVGVGDHACFILNTATRVIKVIFYSLSEKTWSWLPEAPEYGDIDLDIWDAQITAFEPRLDVKP